MEKPPNLQRILSQNAKRRRQYELSKPITPFVSSTFIDFQEEREFLVKKIFPQLNLLCAERGSRFEPLDLRWGISAAQKEKGHLIQNCLDYVRHCSPYFICLLGERYGSHRPPKSDELPRTLEELGDDCDWLTKNLVVAAVTGNYSFILNNTDNHFASITELEITYRLTLQNPSNMFFYLRKPIDFSKFSPSEQTQKKEAMGCESDYAAYRLKNLRRRIRSHVPSEQIREFSTLEELGSQVLEDWGNIIKNEFYDVASSLQGVANEMYQEWQAHAAFQETFGDESRYFATLNSKLALHIDEEITRLYNNVSRGFPPEEALKLYEDCLSNLNRSSLSQYTGPTGGIIVVRGQRGGGKSALLANVSKKHADLPARSHCKGVKVFFHFVGCNSQSEDVCNFMARYVDEMKEYFLDINVQERACLIDAFHAALCYGPSVIFLDGLDQFATSPQFTMQEVKSLSWLPKVLPPGCLIVMSTTPHDQTHRVLTKRTDVTMCDLQLPSTLDHKSEILLCHLGPRKRLEERQKERILSCDLSKNPVFLAAVAKELQLCGGYLSVDANVEKYIGCGNLRTFWELIVRRWATDYGWPLPNEKANSTDGVSTSNWVIDALRLMCVSRNGLSQEEILLCLHSLGYNDEATTIGVFDFMQFRSCAAEVIQARRNGLLYIKHSVAREAVSYAFLNGVCAEQTKLPPHASAPATDLSTRRWLATRLRYQNVIADYLLTQPWSPRVLNELLWQLSNTGAIPKLAKIITSPEIFNIVLSSEKSGQQLVADMHSYWESVLVPEGYDPGKEYLAMVCEVEERGGCILPQTTQVVTMAPSPDIIHTFPTTPGKEDASHAGFSVDDLLAATPVEEDGDTASGFGVPTDANSSDGDLLKSLPELGDSVMSLAFDHQTDTPEFFQRQQQQPQQPVQTDSQWISLIFQRVAQFLESLQRYEEAEYVLKKAYQQQTKFTEKSCDENSQLRFIECVTDIGSNLRKQDKSEEAAQWLNKALELIAVLQMAWEGEQLLSNTLRAKQGKILVDMGHIAFKQGNYDAADSHLELVQLESLLPPNDPYSLKLQYYRACIWHKQGLFTRSRDMFHRTLEQYCTIYGPNHEYLADVLLAYAALLSDRNFVDGFNYFLAEDYLQRALKLKTKHLSARHLEVADCKERLGKLMLSNDKLNSSRLAAYQHLLDAIDIKKIYLGPDKKYTAELQNYLLDSCKAAIKPKSATRDTLVDPDLTIPGSKARGTPPRPVSAMSWNDRDLVLLQQRKNQCARKLAKSRESARTSAHTQRTKSAATAFAAGNDDSQPNSRRNSTTIAATLDSSRTNYVTITELSKPPSAAMYMRTRSRSAGRPPADKIHRANCDVPGKFSLDPSNARSVHGPYSTLDSLMLFRSPSRSESYRSFFNSKVEPVTVSRIATASGFLNASRC